MAEDTLQRSVLVSGLRPNFDDFSLTCLLENKRYKGGDVATVERSQRRTSALVTFEDALVAQTMVSTSLIEFDGMKMTVSWPNQGSEELDGEEMPMVSNKIEVRGSPLPTKDLMQLYFENRNRSGGGDIEDIIYSNDHENVAVIVFKEVSDACNVLKRSNHTFNNCSMEVSALEDDSYLKHVEPSSVVVSGLPPDVKKDILQMFFESERRCGGGECVLHINESDRTAIVTFNEPEVAHQVLSRQPLTFINATLSCTWLRPPPPPHVVLQENVNPNQLLLSYLPLKFTDSELTEYIAKAAGMTPSAVSSVTRSKDSNKVLVHFDDPPDYKKVRMYVHQRPFNGVLVGVERSAQSASIIVYPVSGITQDILETYFENKKRSGGGDIKRCDLHQTHDYAIIEFADYTAVHEVLKRSHSISSKSLQVCAYFKHFGPPAAALFSRTPEVSPQTTNLDDCLLTKKNGEAPEKEPPKLLTDVPKKQPPKLPADIVMPCNVRTVKFITGNYSFREEIEEDLGKHQCEVIWPDVSKSSEVILHCTVDVMHEDDDKVLVDWTKVCSKLCEKHMRKIKCIKMDINPEIWDAFLSEFLSSELEYPDDDLLIEYSNHVLQCTGTEKMVSKFRQRADNNVKRLLNCVPQIVQQTVSLQKHEIALLEMCQFVDECTRRYRSSKTDFTVTFTSSGVTFNGLSADVEDAKAQLNQLTSQFKTRPVKAKLDMLLKPAAKDYLCNKFESVQAKAVLEVSGMSVILHAASQTDLDKALLEINNGWTERRVQLTDNVIPFLTSVEWSSFLEHIQLEYPISSINFSDDNSTLIIVSSAEVVETLVGDVKQILELNQSSETSIPSDAGKVEYVERFLAAEKQLILKDFSGNVSVNISNSREVTVSGNKLAVKEVVSKMKELLEGVIVFHHDSTCAVMKSFCDRKSELVIRSLEDKHKVLIKIQDYNAAASPAPSDALADVQAVAQPVVKWEIKLSSVTIIIAKGDITTCSVDAIVNSTNDSLDFEGDVSKAILLAGGNEIQHQCRQYVRDNGKMLVGSVFKSHSGKLRCQSVYHAVGPHWNGGSNEEEKYLLLTVEKILDMANHDHVKTLAMPAISVGHMKYPVADSTLTMFKSINDFFSDQRHAISLQQIYLMDCSDSILNHFHESAVKTFGKTSVSSKSQTAAPSAAQKTNVSAKPSTQAKYWIGKSQNSVTTPESLTVTLISGSLVDQKVDVIVDPASDELELKLGAVSNALLKKAGDSIQTECKSELAKQAYAGGKLKQGQIIETGPHALQCKRVYHGFCVRWDDGKGVSQKAAEDLMKTCLIRAHLAKMQSIAFPALGTGNLGIPATECAAFMFRQVEDFSRTNARTSLKNVSFVIFDQPTMKTFQDHIVHVMLQCPTPPTAPVRKPRGIKADEGDRRKSQSYGQGATAWPTSPIPDPSSDTVSGGDSLVFNTSDNSITIRQVKLQIKSGADITKEKTDAIVNSTNSRLDLSLGAVSQAIAKAGGKELTDECAKMKCTTNGVAVTKAGKMSCKFVIHLEAPDDQHNWKTVIIRGLAAADSRRLTSVAYPLIGTGARDTAVSDIAAQFMDAIIEYSETVKHLTLVRVSIFQPSMANEFISALTRKCSSGIDVSPRAAVKSGTPVDRPSMSHQASGDQPGEYNMASLVKKKRFCIYGSSQGSIDKVVTEIEEIAKEAIITKVITNPLISTLTSHQISAIGVCCANANVTHEIERSKYMSRVVMKGDATDIASVVDEVTRIINSAEVELQKKMEQELIAKTVSWEYEDNGRYLKYPPDINAVIERAKLCGNPTATWTENDDKIYIIDFTLMIETNPLTPQGRIKVRRVTDIIKLPDTWERMNDNDKYLVVPLTTGSQEFIEVEENAKKTAGGTIAEIRRINRIQNPALYRQYVTRHEELKRTYTASDPLERILWHGTNCETVGLINSGGFNRSYCGANATLYGLGVYFALNWTYSARDLYSKPDVTGWKYIYQCRVLTGEYHLGKKDMKEPPLKPDKSGQRYNSVTDDVNNPAMFVVFHDADVYPEYLIEFNQTKPVNSE